MQPIPRKEVDTRTPIIGFDTARLRLRQWQASDFAPFAVMNADARVMEFFPERLLAHESHATARHIHSLIAARGWGLWAVEVRGGPRFIGFVGLHIPSAELPFSPCVEIGWRLAFEHWGHGYASEAARGALDFAFDVLGLDLIVSFAANANRRSLAVMERLGMRRDAKPFEHPDIPAGHPLRTHLLYRIGRDEWTAQAAQRMEADPG